MNDNMTVSDIEKELDFWYNYIQEKNNFKHKDFYQNFFNFADIGGRCLEIGCGGSPFTTYADSIAQKIELHLLDPLIDQISNVSRYEFLKNYTRYNSNLLNFNSNIFYDSIVCLNVLDHFENNHIEFIQKIHSLLNKKGTVFIYYDIRERYCDGHYSIPHHEIHNYISQIFDIMKESNEINPVHSGWSTVYSSYRAILKAK
jgi:2-polyprenyl-3-methyl-5-hydroxy-6-metoxy-1,4-benzoquinol methylase